MAIKVYNSLTKKKEELVPIDHNIVNLYACGVTVYDKCHIGHARSLYLFDVICRHLKNRGLKVNFVRNITDVDDKIINKSKQANQSFDSVVEENIKLYKKDIKNLKVNFADQEPRATENINEMIAHIQGLMAKGYAYHIEGDVYFKVKAFKGYGKLSGQSVEHMLEAVRIDSDEKKQEALDFVLWKKAKEGEPFWNSPWGKGRPGWHIECSAMSLKYLKCQTLDIHAGGRDLIFPHHENEIAQSEALSGKPFAKYWIHHGLLKINGQKMAKSLGNFITLDEVLEKHSHNILKLFYLQSHYASEIDFSWDKMQEVKKAYERIELLKNKLETQYKFESEDNDVSCDVGQIGHFWEMFLEAMDDDFNTSKALAIVFDFVKKCNATLESDDAVKDLKLSSAVAGLRKMAEALGLDFSKEENALPEELEVLLKERSEARINKDFKRADAIRNCLYQKGIMVEDGKEGQTWRRRAEK